MTGFGSGRRARVLIAALLLALIAPLVPASYQSAVAQDATGGPELGTEFYDPPACSPAGTNGLVVYQTTGDDGITPEQSLTVAGQDGRTVRTIKLSGTPIRLLATPAPNMAVVITESSEHVATRVEVIDAGRGFRYRLAIPREDIGGLIYPSPATIKSSGTRYIVLTNSLQNVAYLVDLADGVATDLMAVAEHRAGHGDLKLIQATVAPDDRTVLFQTDDATILIPTDRPNGDRLVASGETASGFNYAANGSLLLFNRTTSNKQVEIVLLDTEKLTERQLALGDDLVSATPLPNGTAAMLISAKGLAVIDFEYRAQAPIGEIDGEVSSILIGPNSGAIAYLVTNNDEATWYWANLYSGEITAKPDLAGLTPVASPDFPRWIVFTPPGVISSSGRGDQVYSSLDLSTGKTNQLFTTVAGTSYLPPVVSPGAGRYALLPWITGGLQNIVALDNRAGIAQPIFESRAVSGVLSPDGCWAAVTRQIGERTANRLQIVLIPLDGTAEVVKSAAGFAPVWLVGS
jgi:hypothetical protein